MPAGGALSHLFGGNSRSVREGVGRLTRQWFGPPLEPGDGHGRPPLLNDEHLGDTEKLAAVLTYHIERRRPWALLATN
ncbi:MAG: hypothetical protein ACR2HB_00905, partial [Dehalococcoidia bacterium]